MSEAHVRIDEGIKRGPRTKRIKRHIVENEARQRAKDRIRADDGTFLLKYPPEFRKAVVKDAINSIETGESVLSIANRHSLPRQTLESWLIADGSEAAEARTLFFSGQIAECLEGMRVADNPLALAQARDLRRAWAETAQVRDKNFAPKQEVAVTIDHHVQVDLGLTSSANELLSSIRGVALQQAKQVIDLPSDAVQQVENTQSITDGETV